MTSEEYLIERTKPSWNFNSVVSDSSFSHVNKIHPLKQKIVKELVDFARHDESVSRIIVFGSSTKYYCSPFSDLDICVDWVADCYDSEGVLKPFTIGFCRFASKITEGNVDIAHYDYLDGTIIKDAILREGVVVYDNNV